MFSATGTELRHGGNHYALLVSCLGVGMLFLCTMQYSAFGWASEHLAAKLRRCLLDASLKQDVRAAQCLAPSLTG